MKKIILIALVLLLASCGSDVKPVEVKSDSVAVADSSVVVLDSNVAEIK